MKADILVVDDEQDVRQYLVDILEDQGYSVRMAGDGVEAMKQIQAKRPDLVLLDLLMPEETGTGLYRKLHQKKATKDIPVIIISALAGRHLAVGKDVPVFDKLFDEQKLLDTIRSLLGDHQ